MDLDLSRQERALRDEARAILARFAPAENLNRLEASDEGFDPNLWAASVAAGWAGLDSAIELGIVLGEHGRAAAASPLLQAAVSVRAARAAGDVETARKIAAGGRAALVIELDGGSPSWTAAQTLTGGPVTVEWASWAETLLCATREGRLFAIEAGAPGLRLTPASSFDSERIASVEFDHVAAKTAGDLGARYGLDRLRAVSGLLRAAEMLGGAERALEMTIEHVSSRRQFGKPLGVLQAVQHMCADVAMEVDGARLAVFEALWRLDHGLSFAREAVVASWFGGRVAEHATLTASQLHGGLGYVKEYPLHHYVRRAKAQALRLGTERQQLEAIAVEMFDERPETVAF